MKPLGALVSVLIVGTASTGCAATPSTVPETPPAVVQTEQPAAPAVGSTVTTDAEVTAAQDASLGVYVTATGEKVVIDPAAPAPQVMLDEIRATGNTVAGSTTADQHAQADALLEVGARAADAGKKLVFIVASGRYGDFDDSDLKETWFGIMTNAVEIRGPGSYAATREGALALAQERINAQADPSQYEIIDLFAP